MRAIIRVLLTILMISPAFGATTSPGWTAHWPKPHRKTVLDQTFPATLAGSAALQEALIDLALYTRLGWECHVRTLDWAANVENHMKEIAEDPAARLGDTRPPAESKATMENIIAHAGDSFDSKSDSDKAAMCLLVPGAQQLKDADEIGRRPLLRHHDQWEGASE